LRSLGRVVLCGLAFVLVTTPAQGATTFGQTLEPTGNIGTTETLVQNTSPSNGYAAPADGVITAWSFRAADSGAQPIRFKVLRSAGGNDFYIVGESGQVHPSPGVLNTFPAAIPVKEGDFLGLHVIANSVAYTLPGAGYSTRFLTAADPVPDTTATFPSQTPGLQLDVSARLEADVDGDGFGDETQDLCPTDATRQTACDVVPPDSTPPDTTITTMPKANIHKPKAGFAFTSSEIGSTFECKLDDDFGFGPCPSPLTIKVSRGKHALEVRAVDAAGNADPTPAVATWRVVKKKKKRHH
jgi:hypothetical protein